MTEAIKESIWLHGLVVYLGIKQEHVVVFRDSQCAINLVKNQGHYSRTKNMDDCFHFICEIIDDEKNSIRQD